MRRHSTRPQRTIVRPSEVTGVGLLSGANIRLRFLPAPPSTGVVFVRTDLPGRPRISAHVSQVTGTQRRTTLGRLPVQVSLVEHVLAALAGLRIDNCLVEVDAAEPPGLDGSSLGFVKALRAGVQTQAGRRAIWTVDQPFTVRASGATLTLHPPLCDGVKLKGTSADGEADHEPGADAGGELWLTYFLDYGRSAPIARQSHTQRLTPGSFVREAAGCRTFLLESEAVELRRQGLGARTTATDLLVFGSSGPIDNHLRFANEPARHKVLDLIGDLSLLGVDLCGHVVAYRSGHPLNVELTRALNQRLTACPGRVAA